MALVNRQGCQRVRCSIGNLATINFCSFPIGASRTRRTRTQASAVARGPAQQLTTSRRQQRMAVHATSAAATVKSLEQDKFTTPGYRRGLHWVFKVGDLKASLDFYEKVFGMHVHRHEEFASGCEATCNGPYGGAWSKTMVGCVTEETNFALELTYNYGISGYQAGNDLRYLALQSSAVKADPAALGYKVTKDTQGNSIVQAPDGYKYLLVQTEQQSAPEPFLFVSIHTSDLERAKKYYCDVLGARICTGIPGTLGTPDSVVLSFATADKAGASDVKIELVQLPAGVPVEHAEAKGRYATETEDGAEFTIAEKVRQVDPSYILHGPLKLQPHGEEVVIVVDFDGNEYCFVDARGYTNCVNVAYQEGGRTVDWVYREKLNAAALANDKQAIAQLLGGEYSQEDVRAALNEITQNNAVVVFSQTTCPFCKKTKALLAELGAEYRVVELDSLGQQGQAMRAELGVLTGRSTVPNVFISGNSVGGFTDGPGVDTLNKEGKLKPLLQAAGAL